MPFTYPTRSGHNFAVLPEFWDEPEAASSIAPSSSPPAYEVDDEPSVPFNNLPDLPEDDEEDSVYVPSSGIRMQRRSDEEKAFEVLRFMREKLSRFSLRVFLRTILTSGSGGIKNTVNTWKGNGGIPELLDLLCMSSGVRDEAVCDWITERAASICASEASYLTDRAADGPHKAVAHELRTPAQTLSVVRLKAFTLRGLHAQYGRTMARTQRIFRAIVNKDDKGRDPHSRNPEDVRGVRRL